jgi:hypothetical protein
MAGSSRVLYANSNSPAFHFQERQNTVQFAGYNPQFVGGDKITIFSKPFVGSGEVRIVTNAAGLPISAKTTEGYDSRVIDRVGQFIAPAVRSAICEVLSARQVVKRRGQ